MYLTWIYSQFLSTPQDHYNIITGSQLFEHYKKILQRGWKALRTVCYLRFILFSDLKRRKSSLCYRRWLSSKGKWCLTFLGHHGDPGDLAFAEVSFGLGMTFLGKGLGAPKLLVLVCLEGEEIPVINGSLLCNGDAPAQACLGWDHLCVF